MATKGLSGLENTLNDYLGKKAPQLPKNVKTTLVEFMPWLALIGGILSILAGLSIFGLGTAMTGVAMFAGPTVAAEFLSVFTLSLVVLIVSGVLNLMAFGPLKAKKARGWKLLFYAELIWIVSHLLSYQFGNAVLGGLIGLYFLFQVREYYKKHVFFVLVCINFI